MKLYFVRHGESTANVEWIFSNTGFKHPLTENGITQVHALSRSLSELKVKRIYTSPVLRAVQTAEILVQGLDAPLQTVEALREWDVGVYEGTSDPEGWALHSQVQVQWFNHQEYDARMPGGESFNEIQARFIPFIQELVVKEKDTDRNFILVGHGGLYMAMLPVIFENVDFSFSQKLGFPNSGYALGESRADGLYCISWCVFKLDL
jgi:broad specificity phosphatase PhoE